MTINNFWKTWLYSRRWKLQVCYDFTAKLGHNTAAGFKMKILFLKQNNPNHWFFFNYPDPKAAL